MLDETTDPMIHNPISAALFDRARKVIPGGVNSPVRAFKNVGMTPLFVQRAKGSRLWDADGNEYVDYVGSWGPLILGHAHPQVLEAVRKVSESGTSFGAPTELEIRLAETVCRMVPSVELVRFVNSGNEATQGALRVARGYTRRDKIVKFAGCYHGSVDALLVKAGSGAMTLGVPDSAGVPSSVVQDTLIAEFNDLEQLRKLAAAHKGDIAAVIVEPIPGNMGVIEPDPAFLQGLRELCTREKIVLIFDEVMTGFRVARGGAQALFGIKPDLTTFGKIIGGGFPVGAYGGRADIMSCVAPLGPVYQAGTLSGNPVAMAAGLATLSLLEADSLYAGLEAKAKRLCDGLTELGKRHGHPVVTAAYGGMLGFFFSDRPVRNYTDVMETDAPAYVKFFRGMLERGIYLAPSPYEALFVSLAHSDEDLARTLEAAGKAMAAI
jgi:glutamate-1-semialdehyde 2,1-aminomutase